MISRGCRSVGGVGGVGGTEWEWEWEWEWVVQSGWYRVGGTEWVVQSTEWGEYRVGVVGGREW